MGLSGAGGTGLDITFVVVVVIVVLAFAVSALRRRRDRRDGLAGDGHWNEGPYAEPDPPPLSAQHRDRF